MENTQNSTGVGGCPAATCSAMMMADELVTALETKTFGVSSRIQELKREVELLERLHLWLNSQRHAALTLRDTLRKSQNKKYIDQNSA